MLCITWYCNAWISVCRRACARACSKSGEAPARACAVEDKPADERVKNWTEVSFGLTSEQAEAEHDRARKLPGGGAADAYFEGRLLLATGDDRPLDVAFERRQVNVVVAIKGNVENGDDAAHIALDVHGGTAGRAPRPGPPLSSPSLRGQPVQA